MIDDVFGDDDDDDDDSDPRCVDHLWVWRYIDISSNKHWRLTVSHFLFVFSFLI